MKPLERDEQTDMEDFSVVEHISGELRERADELIVSLIYDGYIATKTDYIISKAELKEALLDYAKKKEAQRIEAIKKKINSIYGVDSKEEK